MPPFLLGFLAYTFILLIRTILVLADFAVRRSAPFREVANLVALSLPWIIVLTLPMAFLLGVLVGLGRLGADSELTALSACGVGPGAIYRPLLGAAAVASAGVLFLYNVVLPPANEALQRAMARVAATSIVNVVAPRTFREPRPGITFFFDRVAPDGRSFEGVFLKLGDEVEPPNRIIVARQGGLTLEGDRLWLDLTQSTVHELDPDDPSRYRTTRNASQRLLLAGEPARGGPPGSSVIVQRAWRSQSLTELLAGRSPHATGRSRPQSRAGRDPQEVRHSLRVRRVRLDRDPAGPPAAPRGPRRQLRRVAPDPRRVLRPAHQRRDVGPGRPPLAGRRDVAAERRPPPARAPRSRCGAAKGARRASPALHSRSPCSDSASAALPADARRAAAPPPVSRLRFGVISLADRYVLARFLVALAFVLASSILLSVVVDYVDKLDEVARHHPSSATVFGYYRYFLLSITMQIAPFAILMATLVGLGVLSRNNEDTAFRACGISARRLAAPVALFALAAAGVAFTVGEYVLPFAEQQQERYRNVIYGRPADFGIRTASERNWYLAGDGRIWFREEADPVRGTLDGVTVFETARDGQLVRRTTARVAEWKDNSWLLRQGWDRGFEGAEPASFHKFLEEPMPGDPPRTLAAGRRRPEEMRFRELERLTRRLRASGYPTSSLETALQAKLAQPAMLPVMALLATPFAFRIGRKGTLAGIGVGLGLGIVALVAAAFLTKLGEVGALPPPLAAWSPVVLFGLAGTYFLLRMRT